MHDVSGYRNGRAMQRRLSPATVALACRGTAQPHFTAVLIVRLVVVFTYLF